MYQQEQKYGSYYCIVFGRDGDKSIRKVLDSLLSQTVMPEKIIIIDDGSTDGMYETVQEYGCKHPGMITVHETNNQTRDYTRLPLLRNMGLLDGYDFHMIVPSDASFVTEYAERMLQELAHNPKLVIISGDWGPKKAIAPHGGGRFVRQSFFWKHYPQGYPRILGYESEILERAILNRKEIKVLNDVELFHHDALGHSHNFREFGCGMKCLGYYPPYVFGRFASDFMRNKSMGKKGALKMLWYYLVFRPSRDGYYSVFPDDLRSAIRQRQKKYMNSLVRRAARKLLRRRKLDPATVPTPILPAAADKTSSQFPIVRSKTYRSVGQN